ncbi:MAG: transposase [Desulfovibrio sp.]|nr:transposase [Desulfovibrio sp.]
MSRGGRNTKIHAVVNSSSHLCLFKITAGNVNDCIADKEILEEFSKEQKVDYILGDKAYGTSKIIAEAKRIGAEICILPKSNAVNPRDYDKELYKNRNIVERFFVSAHG